MWQLLGKGCVSLQFFHNNIVNIQCFHSTFASRAKLFLLNIFSYFLSPFLGLFSFCAGDCLSSRVFLSRNYWLIVAPRKFVVLKTNIYLRREASRANMLVLRTSNFQGATIVFIVHH